MFRAQSGTGKTATFSISVLQCLDVAVRETQALILSPTRELAVQIQKVTTTLLFIIILFFFDHFLTSLCSYIRR